MLTAIFVTVPFLLRHLLAEEYQWRVFLPVLAVGLVALILGPRLSEKRGRSKKVAVVGHLVLAASLIVLALGVPASVREPRVGLTTLIAGLLLFVIAFALLEPLFPALLTRFCPPSTRGTAAGVYNMSMFSGAFVGGVVSGLLHRVKRRGALLDPHRHHAGLDRAGDDASGSRTRSGGSGAPFSVCIVIGAGAPKRLGGARAREAHQHRQHRPCQRVDRVVVSPVDRSQRQRGNDERKKDRPAAGDSARP